MNYGQSDLPGSEHRFIFYLEDLHIFKRLSDNFIIPAESTKQVHTNKFFSDETIIASTTYLKEFHTQIYAERILR